MPEIGEKFYRSTLVSPDVAPGNDGGGEEYMAKVKTPNQHNGVKFFLESSPSASWSKTSRNLNVKNGRQSPD